MPNDLAQIAKAKGIQRTLAMMAILSSEPVSTENCPNLQENEGSKSDKQVVRQILS